VQESHGKKELKVLLTSALRALVKDTNIKIIDKFQVKKVTF